MLQTRLKVAEPEALDLGVTFGITLERMNALSKDLDDWCKATEGPPRLIYLITVIQYMEEICDTQEEFVWLMNNHIAWLYRTGRALALKSKV